jgi:hypothetical protein
LRTRFVANGLAVGMEESETDGELEIEPDPLVVEPFLPPSGCFGAKSETDGELEIEPDPLMAEPISPGPECHATKSETDGELEIEPDPLRTGPQSLSLGSVEKEHYDLAGVLSFLAPHLCELCQQGETDDHGDGFACSTALSWSDPIDGELSNDWGDDRDFFRFRLARLTTVELRVSSEFEMMGELYDGHGQRLGVAFGNGDGLRMVQTLVPGTYFVRLEGREGASGRYSLAVLLGYGLAEGGRE